MPLNRKLLKEKSHGKSTAYKFLIIGVILLIIVIIIDAQIRPVIKTMSGNQVQILAARAVNQAVYNQINLNAINYESLVTLGKNVNGEITSIESNIMGVNRVNADITQNVIQNLAQLKTTNIYVPIGTLLSAPLLSGRGPSIEIKVIPTGFVNTKIVSNFTAAGINQTRHSIDMEIDVTVSAIIPGYSSSVKVNTNFQIAETVIVGSVPDSYTQVLFNSSKEIE